MSPMTAFDGAVGIVGAGPVGLSCALRLASFGVPNVVLEADPTLVKQGSKACLIQGDVLDILDKFGCAEEVAKEGVTWDTARTYVRGSEIEKRLYPRPPGYGPFVNISQYRVQQVLLEHLARSSLAEVRWSHRVFDVSQDEEGVTVHVATPDGSSLMRFPYLVGCDGIRSEIRELVGAEWLGYTHRDRFLITDIRASLPLAHERHFHYDPPSNPGRQLVMHAQPNDVWRIDWQLPPDVNIAEERRTGALEQRIRAVVGDASYEIDWLSTYRFCQRCVDQMRVERVFLAGDAAHALPPYGARGMNSGIQDVDNLAWKLALVLEGRADESLLDTYHPERHSAALENLRITEATIKFMVPPNRAQRLGRNLLLRVSRPVKRLRRRVNSGTMAEPFTYADSSLVDTSEQHALLGALAPDFYASVGGATRRLRTLLGETLVLLYFAADINSARQLVDATRAVCSASGVRLIVVLPPGAEMGGVTLAGATVVRDEDPSRSAVYGGAPRCFILRPDGHVAAARMRLATEQLEHLLRVCAHFRAAPPRASSGVAAPGRMHLVAPPPSAQPPAEQRRPAAE